MDKISLTEKIKNKAKDIGFDLVGITSAEPFYEVEERLKKRKLSSFTEKDIKKLINPAIQMPEAVSIISLGLSYAVNQDKEDEIFISRYARGNDYHQVMKRMLDSLICCIKGIEQEAILKAMVDTTPLLEREIACRAGLGWIGKNNNLINPGYGSYIFLGEILTDLNLEYDSEMEDRCSNCQACINNCPTEALTASYIFDPDICISFLTQKKGLLNEGEKEFIGINLWGCDKCQEICPYNKDKPVNTHSEFERQLMGAPTELLGRNKVLDDSWHNSSLSWRGLRILKRNAIINIVNGKLKKYIPLLGEELNNPSPIIRTYAVWALGKLKVISLKKELKELYFREKEDMVREEIIRIFRDNDWGELDDRVENK